MARDGVHVIGFAAAEPAAVWAVARDFCGAWHPGIATITEERGPRGAVIRRFTALGEETVYREQLTYLSLHILILRVSRVPAAMARA
jgi:hypothetical protein